MSTRVNCFSLIITTNAPRSRVTNMSLQQPWASVSIMHAIQLALWQLLGVTCQHGADKTQACAW
jgi:hypothetical protein